MQLFIIDNALTDKVGHHFNEALGFLKEAGRQGLKTHFYVHEKATDEIVTALDARPVFPFKPYANVSAEPTAGPLEDFFSISRGFAEACAALVEDGVTPDDIVCVPTAFQHELLGCAQWLTAFPRKETPFVFMNFLFENYVSGNPPKFNIRAALYRYATKALRQATIDEKLFFITANPRFAERLEKVTLKSVTEYPVPMYYDLPGMSGKVPGAAMRDGRVQVSILGHSRTEKGWSLIPDIVRLCRETIPRAAFFIQVSPEGMKKQWGSDFDFLHAMDDVELFLGPSDEAQHRHHLRQSDILLLPYDGLAFQQRTSGVFAESVAFGKVAVVPRGTWMAEQIQAGRGVGTLFEDHSAGSIATAVGEAVAGMESLRVRARGLMEVWRREHSVGNFLERMVAQVQG